MGELIFGCFSTDEEFGHRQFTASEKPLNDSLTKFIVMTPAERRELVIEVVKRWEAYRWNCCVRREGKYMAVDEFIKEQEI